MSIKRITRHLLQHHWRAKQVFTPNVVTRIEQAIKQSETTHAGQIRFVVEGALDGTALFRNQPARERALDVFSHLRIWDTAHNNGVLIYLLLADRDVEIVADRGINRRVTQDAWDAICSAMERAFGEGRFEDGAVEGVAAIGELLSQHFPRTAPGPNELPDTPIVL